MHLDNCVHYALYVYVYTQVSQWYELVVFTASMEIYGSAVADKLDNNRNILKRRYYRQVPLKALFTHHSKHYSGCTPHPLRPLKCFHSMLTLCCVFFQHCTLDLGSYIKDLSVVHDDLSSIVILDNSPGAYRSHPGKTWSLMDSPATPLHDSFFHLFIYLYWFSILFSFFVRAKIIQWRYLNTGVLSVSHGLVEIKLKKTGASSQIISFFQLLGVFCCDTSVCLVVSDFRRQ